MNNIGKIHFLSGRLKEAEEAYKQALDLKKAIKDYKGIAYVLTNQGALSLRLEKYPQAKEQLGAALQLAREIGAKELILENYALTGNLYKEQGNHKQAIYYYEHHAALNDSIFNERKSKTLIDLQLWYETEKKEQEILLLRYETERKQLFIYSLIAVLFSCSFLRLWPTTVTESRKKAIKRSKP